MRRKMWRYFAVLGLAAALPVQALAQETMQVTGQVTSSATQQPLPGVQVVVKGTTIGAPTDGQGRYSLRVPAGRTTLVFSYIGYRTVEAEISGQTVNVTLEIEPIGLEGVVVTALGMQREKKDLGYSVQSVQGEQLSDVPDLNVINTLSGNVAGVQVTNAGPTGGSSRIIIRGASSITGNNQPLIIVDGVPIDNSAPRLEGFGGVDYGNAAADIDPANIQSVSVLKGPNAAALYGSRAANGAIVITTKSGRAASGEGFGITVSSSVMFDTPLKLPTYQNRYGQGFNGEFEFVTGDGAGAGTNDGADESWGPPLDGRTIRQFFGEGPWVPASDNVRNFFELGRTVNTNVAVARSGERTNVRLSINRLGVDGMAPGNTLGRTSVALKGGVQMTERLSAEGSMNYVTSEGDNRPQTGYSGNNFMQQFVWFGRQVDISRLKNYKNEFGEQYNWNYNYHSNPYWIALENRNWDTRDRIIGHVNLSYQLTDWLTASAQTGRDWYEDHRKRTYAVGTLESPRGAFGENVNSVSETNSQLVLTATRSLTPDLTLTVNAGANQRTNTARYHTISVEELSVPGIYSLANAGVTPDVGDEYTEKKVNSLRSSASLNYKGFLNVDLTGSNDWSSTLPEDHNSFFYPSVSGAFVFTDAFGIENDLLSSGKVRASWTRVGNDTDPYQTTAVYSAVTPWGGIPGYEVPDAMANQNLKPEETTSIELGTDLGFLNERLGFVVTYYDSRTRNQIFGVPVSAASGNRSQILNAGEVRNWGYELLLNATPVRLENGFQWDMTVNWSKNNSEIVDLYGETEAILLGTYWGLQIQARKGEPYGALFGNGYQRNDRDQIIVNDDGYPMRNPQKEVLGNYNPDWVAGINNRIRYGSFDLSFLVDMKQGGEIFSVTNYFGNYAGVLESSLRGREISMTPVQDSTGATIDHACEPGIVIEGVRQDGSPNTTKICPQNYFHNLYNTHESAIYDASFVKLREARLGYRLPDSLARRLGFSGANVALVGRNLWLWAKAPNIDPETAFDASNVQGIEFGQFPTARSIGFTVSVQP